MRPIYLVWLVGLTALAPLGCQNPCGGSTLCDILVDGSSSHDGSAHHDAATSAAGCPTTALGTALPLTYNGDTTGKADLVKSARLEWGSAPDDALLFVAPQAGTYAVAMTSQPSTNGGCGASGEDFSSMAFYTEGSCPAAGQVADLDGIYTATSGSGSDVTLTQGQHLLLWVSCTTWSSAKTGPYTLTITKK